MFPRFAVGLFLFVVVAAAQDRSANVVLPPQREVHLTEGILIPSYSTWIVNQAWGRFIVNNWEHGHYATWRRFLNDEQAPEVRLYDGEGRLVRDLTVDVAERVRLSSISVTPKGNLLMTAQLGQRKEGQGFQHRGQDWYGGEFLVVSGSGAPQTIPMNEYTPVAACTTDDKTFWTISWHQRLRSAFLLEVDGRGQELTQVEIPQNMQHLRWLEVTAVLRCTKSRVGLYSKSTWFEYDPASRKLQQWKITPDTYLKPSGLIFRESGEVMLSYDEHHHVTRRDRPSPFSEVLRLAALPNHRHGGVFYYGLFRLHRSEMLPTAQLEHVSGVMGERKRRGNHAGEFVRLLGLDGDQLVYLTEGPSGKRVAWTKP